MKSIIRLPGLIAFFVIVGLISGISIVFMDVWIKLIAEKSLAKATGAEVNISSVEHTFSPFGITLNHIQLTDPKAPKTNQFEAQFVSAKIDLAPLLLRKLIIDDLTISGVKLGALRESEGDVYRKPAENQVQDENIFADAITLPSVDDILAKSPLKTTKAIENTQAVYAKHSTTLKQQYAALPDKNQLADYQTRIKALTETDYKDPIKLVAAKKEFDILKDEILKDKKRLSNFKQSISQAKNELTPQLAALKAAPGQDYAQLQSLIAGDADTINDVTTLVFGEKAAKWSQYVLAAFNMVGPMLNAQGQAEEQTIGYAGKWVSFDDTSSLPDMWIKKAQISLQWQQEQIVSHWQDITHQHDVLGSPTVFSVNSTSSSLWQSLILNGDLWLGETGAKMNQNWALSGLKLAEMDLVSQDKLTSQLNSGLLSSTGQAALDAGAISGKASIDLKSLIIQATGSNKMTNIVADTLNQLKNLTINSDISGTIDNIDLSFSSDLNKQIGGALLSNISTEQQAKLDELRQKLNQKTEGLLGEKNSQLSQWLDWEKLADGDLGKINKLLEAKLDSIVEQKKDELKKRLLDK
ncbi:MAG: TIGR03545 family protein, partial [Paraglaciecola sp.]|nr:TIGR03545 family protein [Paraglaciecola sp.]